MVIRGDWSTRDPRPVTGRESGLALAAAAGVVGISIWIAHSHGALDIPRNDDWVYLRSSYDLAESGEFAPGWAAAMVVGQTVMALPLIAVFGERILPLQMLVAGLAVLALWLAYLVVRSIVPRVWAVLSVGLLALGPIFASLAVSFMTDVPAMAFTMATLVLGRRAIVGSEVSLPALVGALVAGLVGVSIREYVIAAPLAVCWVILSRRSQASRSPRVLAPIVLFCIACAALVVWRQRVPAWPPPMDAGQDWLLTTLALAMTLAFLLTGVALVLSPRRIVRAVPPIPAATLAATVLVVWSLLIVRGPNGALLGNYVTLFGSYPGTIAGTSAPVMPTWAWQLVQLLALASTMVLVLALMARPAVRMQPADEGQQDARRLLVVFLGLQVAVLCGASVVLGAPVFDRATIVLVPIAASLVIRRALDHDLLPRAPGPRAVALLASWALLGAFFIDASATFDGARWRLASQVQRAGIPAAEIDGGYEWFGYHQTQPVVNPTHIEGLTWWVGGFNPDRLCAISWSVSGSDTVNPGRVIAEAEATSRLGAHFRLVATSGPDACYR